jgi:hypothetical protein
MRPKQRVKNKGKRMAKKKGMILNQRIKKGEQKNGKETKSNRYAG